MTFLSDVGKLSKESDSPDYVPSRFSYNDHTTKRLPQHCCDQNCQGTTGTHPDLPNKKILIQYRDYRPPIVPMVL